MRIEDYSFGRLVVDGQLHTKDLIVLPDEVLPGWWRAAGHSLAPEDLEAVFAAAPRMLIVGTGRFGLMRVPRGTAAAVEERGIALEVLRTRAACERFNELCGEGDVAAALHLTC